MKVNHASAAATGKMLSALSAPNSLFLKLDVSSTQDAADVEFLFMNTLVHCWRSKVMPSNDIKLFMNKNIQHKRLLQLLLCAAGAQLPRAVAGAGLRDGDHCQAGAGGAVAQGIDAARISTEHDRHRLGDRLLPAGGARAEDHALADRGAA